MTTVLENAFPESRQASAGQIQAELNLFRQDLSSGVFEIVYAGGEKYYLFFSEGQLIDCYKRDPGEIARMEYLNPGTFFAGKGDAHLRICNMSPRFFRHLKTLIHHFASGEEQNLQTDQVMAVIDKMKVEPSPLLIHVQWSTAEGFTFIPGKGLPAREFLFLNQSQSHGNNPGMTVLSRWPEPECLLTVYKSDDALGIWKENFLFLGFSIIFEKLILRYDELVGKTLVTRLENNLNASARGQSVGIFFADKSVDDAHSFISLSDASAAYRSLFKLASQQMSAVVGPRLISQAVTDILDDINPALAKLITEKRIFETTA